MTFPAPTVVVHRDEATLEQSLAVRLIAAVHKAQSLRGRASVALAGGGLAHRVLAAVAVSAARNSVRWSEVDIWWSDERFVPRDDPERNELQAREALLDRLPLDPARVHPMGAAGGADGDDVDAAAARYTAELRAAAPSGYELPPFDVLLLGLGPDGHIASLFPGHPGAHDERPVVPVHGAPKPPPLRISLGVRGINAAREVWVAAAGVGKAGAAAMALSGAGPLQVPAAGVRGTKQTLWLLDGSAASQLPRDLVRR